MKPCPICGKPSFEASKPFCSERCRDVDLHRWLSGSYAIPAADSGEEDDEAEGVVIGPATVPRTP
ncbi:MAG: DNA gyrase inhibitor YacG [Xanthobacteraceae bacterium]|nr:DNA gyrase inhibitor YacG [Xanthobacteraceae bacterium]